MTLQAENIRSSHLFLACRELSWPCAVAVATPQTRRILYAFLSFHFVRLDGPTPSFRVNRRGWSQQEPFQCNGDGEDGLRAAGVGRRRTPGPHALAADHGNATARAVGGRCPQTSCLCPCRQQVQAALPANVSIRYLDSWPVHPYRTATALLLHCPFDLSLHGITSKLHLLLQHIAEVLSVTVQGQLVC